MKSPHSVPVQWCHSLATDLAVLFFHLQKKRNYPRFVVKEMESMYIDELKASINLLMANLESLPVTKGSAESKYSLQKFKRYNK